MRSLLKGYTINYAESIFIPAVKYGTSLMKKVLVFEFEFWFWVSIDQLDA